MRLFRSGWSPFSLLLAVLSVLSVLPLTSAIRVIESKSLSSCQQNSGLSATLFNVVFTPDNRTITFKVVGVSEISKNITIDFRVYAYGFTVFQNTINTCSDSVDLKGLCPMSAGQINIESNFPLEQKDVDRIPSIAFTFPDIDGKVQIYLNQTETGTSLACVEAELSNGKTVYQPAVAWVVAVIAGSGLVVSAIVSGLGHSNTAAHVASNALTLFGFFQAQAMIGMTAVDLPPMVASWTQNFQWSMGIIHVGFLQRMCTWYQRATGGTPSSLLSSLSAVSVNVQKRSLQRMVELYEAAYATLRKRVNSGATQAEIQTQTTIHGIERVGFRANIEITNIFLTGYSFFIIFVILVVLGVWIFKLACEGLTKAGKMSGNKFQDFRNGWKTVLKGILFRIVLIGFPQMVILCFWELTVRDSAAEVALAIFTLVTMVCILGWASSKVIRIAQRSIMMHKNPAYILYSDPVSLNKWGFLYVQFKATAYYFIVPILAFLLVKGMFVGLGQGSGTAQAIALVLLDVALLITISIMRPYMDRKTNGLNIALCAVNFASAIFLLVFTNIFNAPRMVIGVMGVIFFIINAAFGLFLILYVIFYGGRALYDKNPDTRYQPMRDDRGSFIKSQTQLATTELDALGATARGEGKGPYKSNRLDDDDSSFSSTLEQGRGVPKIDTGRATPVGATGPYRDPPRSPVDPAVPLFPGSGNDGRHGPPSYRSSPPPAGYYGQQAPSFRQTPSVRSDVSAYRGQNNSSPWQRGAGYDGH